MEKIVLINPPLYYKNGNPHSLDVSVPPLGLLYLASYINTYAQDFFEALVLDIAPENLTLEKIGDYINEIKPMVIGITSMTPQLQGALELARFIKGNNFRKAKLFLGGPHISADPDFIFRFKNVFDYGITGEGEKTFLESLFLIKANKPLPRLQAGEALMKLDAIPFPDKTLIKREKYGPFESMMFSRGCPYHCYYCSRPSISRVVRYRSVDNLIAEIKKVYSGCQGKIDFQDDTFTLHKKRVQEFCEKVLVENLKIKWRCNTRVDYVDEELLVWMKKAGCLLIHFGVESGNENLRQNIINKGKFTNREIKKAFSLCKKTGIGVGAYFMLGHPGESEKNLKETREMVFSFDIDLLGLSLPTPFPGSELYSIAESRGIINKKIIDDFAEKKLGVGYTGNYPVFISEKLSPEGVFSQMKEINQKFYFRRQVFTARLREDFRSPKRLKKDALDLFSLIVKGVSSRKPYVQKN